MTKVRKTSQGSLAFGSFRGLKKWKLDLPALKFEASFIQEIRFVNLDVSISTLLAECVVIMI